MNVRTWTGAVVALCIAAAPYARADVYVEDFEDNDNPGQPGFDPAFVHDLDSCNYCCVPECDAMPPEDLCGIWFCGSGDNDDVRFNLPEGQIVTRVEVGLSDHCGTDCSWVRFFPAGGGAPVQLTCPAYSPAVLTTDGLGLGEIERVEIGSYEGRCTFIEIETSGGGADCNGNGVPDADDIAEGPSTDANDNGVPDECEGEDGTTTIEGLDQDESTTIVPGGGTLDPTEGAIVEMTNVSGPDDATVTVTENEGNPHPDGGLYGILGGTTSVEVESTLEDGQFWMRVMIPFELSDLPPAWPWHWVDVTYYDAATGNWVLAVQRNTANSPGHPGPVGDRYPPTPPLPSGQLSDDLGDFGVSWDADAMKGFAWANVDHLSDFAVGINVCPADADVSGDVDVDDLLAVILAWNTNGLGTPGVYTDVNNSGNVDVDDLLAVILAWGACPQPSP